MARRDPGKYRDIDGVLILDKPLDRSSNHALQQVRRLYRARKAGHCGSLDPLATGVLPICLGQATKFSSYLLNASKTYRASCRLGQKTSTGDAEGEVIETRPVSVDSEQLQRVLERFVGQIDQVPPMYSALKHEGRRLYQIAREGRQVERKPRRVEIHELTLLSCADGCLEIEVRCSKGTYIRTLAEDIGAGLGCGAHIAALRRVAVDHLLAADAVTIAQLELLAQQGTEHLDRLLQPVTVALNRFAELNLDAASSTDIRQGKKITLTDSMTAGLYRLVAPDAAFIGLGEVSAEGELTAKRLMNTAR
ncbi:MAG: tRNA pseudouridine(55) synthase TruB [Gammaproteobacteria bacterium]|nr:tRNA pseudouridine(55) synthase TruB [Gammaproteobacteria bacterium]MDH3536866.1 tRNA pseudouridine(55) synthase TruB [Gammaproteobacteria bacterium]